RLHFLRLNQVAFDSFAFGDIRSGAGDANHLAGSVPDLKPAAKDPAHRTVRARNSKLGARAGFFRRELAKGGEYEIAFLRPDGLAPLLRVCVEALDGSAPYLFIRGTDVVYLLHVTRAYIEYVGDIIRQLAEFFLAFAQCLFGTLAFDAQGDVVG